MELIKNPYFLFVCFISIIIRFPHDLPTIWVDDSVKYFIPLQVIATHDFTWIMDSINFSTITRILNYFVEINSHGSADGIIIYQKVGIIIATIFFYLTCLELSQHNHKISSIFTLIFTINPLMLFFEQVILPDSIFILIGVLMSFFMVKTLQTLNYRYAVLTGISIGLLILTKDSGSLLSSCIFISLFIASMIPALTKKKYQLLICSFLIFLSANLILLPSKIYINSKFGEFKVSRKTKNIGALLWFITEDMIQESPPKIYPWLTNSLIQLTQYFKNVYGANPNQYDRLAFESAISRICVLGRENQLVDPTTNRLLSSEEWGKIVFKYYMHNLLGNPSKSLKAIMYNADIFLFKENYYFWPYKKSTRANSEYEAVQFTQIPYSLTNQIDPKLKDKPVIDTGLLTEKNIFQDIDRTIVFKDVIPVMVNRDLNKAFLIPEKGIGIWIQKTLKFFPFMRFLIPLFLISLIIFIINKNNWKNFDEVIIALFFLGSTLLFLLMPLFVHGEARYQLQFTHFMLFFIISVITKFKKINS